MTNDDNVKELLAQKILSYLAMHPHAGDTLEGIAHWWLEQQQIEVLVDEVASALDLLKGSGTINTHRSRSGAIIYKVKK